MKEYKNGLVLGKFMPVHNGHIHLIEQALLKCDTVHVIVCTRICEPINGLDRFLWMAKIFKDNKNVRVHHCTDDNPQYPEDCENFYEIWNKSVYSLISELDVVFASENYVYPFANSLGVKAELVDVDRISVPISATKIRENPFKYWNYIPDIVKDYFRLNIAIVGPESSGKTTLVNELHTFFDSDIVLEYGREFVDNLRDSKLRPYDFSTIVENHNKEIIRVRGNCDVSSKMIFIDTEAIVTKTFYKMYENLYGWDDKSYSYELTKEIVLEHIDNKINEQIFGQSCNKIDFYLLLYPDLDWEDDGTRDFKNYEDRLKSFLTIKHELERNNCNYFIIRGKSNRLKSAIEIINNAENTFREKPWHKISFDR